MNKKTNEEYIEDPNSCPFCGSEEVSWNTDSDMEGDSIFRENQCDSCKKEWVETYTLTGYEEVD